ncbi:MAG: S8 family serine peptidase [Chthoniobacterales bacterium]
MAKLLRVKVGSLRRVIGLLLLLGGIAAALGAIASSRAVNSADGPEQTAALRKIAPWVMEHTGGGQNAEFMIVLADQADLSGASALKTKKEKGRFVRDALWNKSQTTQGSVLQWLDDHKLEHRSFYIVNAIWVKGRYEDALALALRTDIARVEGNPQVRSVPDPVPAVDAPTQPNSPASVEPGIAYTHAPDVWAQGFLGQGLVVAGADTGFRWTHNAIKPHYRGWNGSTANHDYNWHDSVHSGGGVCGPNSPAPCDDSGHGTHTLGTAIGDDGAGNQIGMAPQAECIGCRNMNVGVGTPASYMECFEFFLAPYPVGGTPAQGDPSKAPDITTNSWTCPSSEGCSPDTLKAGVEAQRAAGIMMVVAAGNSGSSCSTVSDPPAIYDAVYTVGALNTGTDTIASFSSRGPVTVDGSMRLKPDITAPGTNTRSSYSTSDSSYAFLSGTSMATPHIAGAVALLWSAHPELRDDLSATESALNNSAVPLLADTCDGGAPSSPNNTFGYGRIDILAAVGSSSSFSLTGATSVKSHGSQTFGIPLPLSGEPGVECRNQRNSQTLIFTFSAPVVSGDASLTSGSGRVAGSPAFTGNTMTVNLTQVTDVQKITLTLSSVTSNSSQMLPDTAVSMNVLVGDVDASKTVDATDVSTTRSQVGSPVTKANFREDVRVDGTINNGDVKGVRNATGHSLP